MRYFYSLVMYLISPLILFYFKKLSAKNPDYNLFLNERFSFNLINNSVKPIIWIHAASVGETRALSKLVELIEINYSNYQIMITNMTPTGRKTVKDLFPNVINHYVPIDLPHAVINFYKKFKPTIVLVMEMEIWPNLIFYANKFSIPIFLINARLSNKSFKSYKRFKFFINPILNKFTGILCQDINTYNNFKQLGYKKFIQIVGSTKFDIVINDNQFKVAEYLKKDIVSKKVIIFASIREGEEEYVLDCLNKNARYLVIIVPRHLERFQFVETLLEDRNIKYQKRSDNQSVKEDTQVFLGDSLGEMFTYYFMSDIAVMGGSFKEYGGQNLIEPLFLNKPVIFGPHMFNFKVIANNALNNGCALKVNNMSECFKEIEFLLSDIEKYQKMVKQSRIFIKNYQGASENIILIIKKYL